MRRWPAGSTPTTGTSPIRPSRTPTTSRSPRSGRCSSDRCPERHSRTRLTPSAGSFSQNGRPVLQRRRQRPRREMAGNPSPRSPRTASAGGARRSRALQHDCQVSASRDEGDGAAGASSTTSMSVPPVPASSTTRRSADAVRSRCGRTRAAGSDTTIDTPMPEQPQRRRFGSLPAAAARDGGHLHPVAVPHSGPGRSLRHELRGGAARHHVLLPIGKAQQHPGVAERRDGLQRGRRSLRGEHQVHRLAAAFAQHGTEDVDEGALVVLGEPAQ